MGASDFRWHLAEDQPQGLFERSRRVVGRGAYRSLTFWEVEARSIINEVPNPARLPFRYTINPYRGCSHACVYCLSGETPILMGDGRSKPLADIRPGEVVYGTVKDGSYRRYVLTEVLDHWSTKKLGYRIALADGTELIASGDHRFLTDRGWKFVTGAHQGAGRRAHLTTSNRLLGFGALPTAEPVTDAYRRGYLCGLIRGDGHIGSYAYDRVGRSSAVVHRFRVALVDPEPLTRARLYLKSFGIETKEFVFREPTENVATMTAIRTSRGSAIARIRELIAWPERPTTDWRRGFLAGIFDAEGSHSRGILRISNTDPRIVAQTLESVRSLGFSASVDTANRARKLSYVRITGGLRAHMRFFALCDPAIDRKRSIDGTAVKFREATQVEAIEPLSIELPMFDITTGTGDFIANGVISHNCFARPTHDYLGFDMGRDFDTQIVVKVNAVDLLRAETHPGRWSGEHIAMGTNTDPYQKAEAKYHLTRGIIEVLTERENPFSILTKSTLALRDLDLLREAAARMEISVDFSIGTLDEQVWRETEPGTPPPWKRMEAVAKLNEAGVPSGVLIAPILPGLSDAPEQVAAVRRAARQAGARHASTIVLHLRPGVREHYMSWLEQAHPELVPKYRELYRNRAYISRGRGRRTTPRPRTKPKRDEELQLRLF